ncbi:hypothetical protein JZ751_020967 [Albula glossodonta]|uniref:Ig-like domain-containing protein n=1 Tax=Albula glossodonta TaxID=121402 RepID=A0A8T2PGU5_9TELE|nr:hypothetical protein JZ751_020967 [Albula glossodonta]
MEVKLSPVYTTENEYSFIIQRKTDVSAQEEVSAGWASKNTLSDRFTGVPNAENETTELRISNVTESDLALYYCVGRLRGILQFGKGTRLYREPSHEADPQAPKQDLSSQSSFPSFYMIYASLLGLGQLGMICAVFTVHPSFSKNVSVSAGDQVILPCYFRISRQTPDEKLFVQWKVGDKVVLQLTSGEFTYGSKFRSRVDISLERIRQGNLSLHLRNTSRHDSGDYQCSIKNKNVIITLEMPPEQVPLLHSDITLYNIWS